MGFAGAVTASRGRDRRSVTRIFIGLFVTLVVSLSSLTGVGPVGPAPAAWAGNGGAFVLVSLMRRWGPLNSRSKHAIGGAIVLLSATPAVILGWLSTVTIVVWWGLGLGLLAMLIYLFVRPRRDGNQ